MSNVSATARDIVQRLWNASKSLQGGGVSYLDYVSELTFLLFLKMLEERKREDAVPLSCRWSTLKRLDGIELLTAYRRALLDLGDPKNANTTSSLIRIIYADAKTSITQPASLRSLFSVIDQVDWFSLDEDGIGDLYEGLLERTVGERKSKAGQYFTPRALIETMIRIMDPQPGETIQDPAAGTGGFLIVAHQHIRRATDDLFTLQSDQAFFQRHNAYRGVELIGSTRRLGIMNMMLHGIEAVLDDGDSLGPEGEALGQADLILTNPPFNKFPERVARSDFVITASAPKGPLPFVEHVVRGLVPGGRAAIVVPDNVLFDDTIGRRLRQWLMEMCNLHTILKLPTGIFYAPGVMTNVLFLQRGMTDRGNTEAVWVYDLRANMPPFGKTRPLTLADFAQFLAVYGTDPNGTTERVDEGPEGRFRKFTREEISSLGDSLDFNWLRNDSQEFADDLVEAEEIATAVADQIRLALAQMEALETELTADDVIPAEVDDDRPAPPGWAWTTVSEISSAMFDGPFGSALKTSDYRTEGVRVARLENIGHLRFRRELESFVSLEKFNSLQRHTLRSEDVLFSSFVDQQTRVCLVPHDLDGVMMNKADCFCVRANREICDPRFLAFSLAAPSSYEAFSGAVRGVTRPRIGLRDLARFQLALPPLAEQRRIVAKLEELTARTARVRASLSNLTAQSTNSRKLLDRLDQALLAKAVRGELVHQDSSDEPASVVLGRLRAARDAAPKAKRGRKPTAAA